MSLRLEHEALQFSSNYVPIQIEREKGRTNERMGLGKKGKFPFSRFPLSLYSHQNTSEETAMNAFDINKAMKMPSNAAAANNVV